MAWYEQTLDLLASKPCWGYRRDIPPAVEPTALAAMALIAGRRPQQARPALDWLAGLQARDGSLGIDAANPRPRWPTGWAVLAWRAGCASAQNPPWADAAQQAVAWILSLRGSTFPRSKTLGHDTTLCGWPWVETTHSWIEPTAINLMALKKSGQADHTRSREAVDLLLDRMLPSGGWNYGNTVVFGSTLYPHVQPTGLALAALHDEPKAAQRVKRSIAFLHRTLCERTTTASLCYALIGAAAHGDPPHAADRWLAAASRRTLAEEASPYLLALAVLAHTADGCPWFADTPAPQRS